MQIKNAIKKLEKAGYQVEAEDQSGKFRAVNDRFVIVFYRNGGSDDAVCFGSTRTTAAPNVEPFFGWPNLSQIIRSHAETISSELAAAGN